MSFNKRYLSREVIEKKAKDSSFDEFRKYLTSPDALIFLDDWASALWDRFYKAESEERIKIHESLRNQ